MKIGVFLPEISPQNGGAFTFAETAVSGLADSHHKDEFHVFYYGKSFKNQGTTNSLRYHSLGSGGIKKFLRKIFDFFMVPYIQSLVFHLNQKLKLNLEYPSSSALDSMVKREAVDLMWFPTPRYEKVDIPYIITVWDLEHRIQPYFPELSRYGEWEGRESYFRKALPRASFIVTGTNVGKEEICRFYGISPDLVKILPHPTPDFALENHPEQALPEVVGQEPYLFYPAQFWSHKNHYTLLCAVAELKKKNRKVNCVFVGSDKGNLNYIKRVAVDLGIGDQIKFPGFVSRPELVALYKKSLATVYPSTCGPENLPPLEAMALGSPVIASNILGAQEQLGEAAYLVDCLNSQELAQAIIRIADDLEFRKSLIDRGKDRAQKYTKKEFTKDFLILIEKFRTLKALWGE